MRDAPNKGHTLGSLLYLIADGCHSVCDRNYLAVRMDVTDAVTKQAALCKSASAASLPASAASEANHTSKQNPPIPGEVPDLLSASLDGTFVAAKKSQAYSIYTCAMYTTTRTFYDTWQRKYSDTMTF